MLRVLSLGAGVQSTTLALMAAKGEIAPPDFAIFADTGWEPRAVYEHLDRLERALPFPVIIVTAGNIRDDVLAMAYGTRRHGKRPSPPFYVRGEAVNGLLSRNCTEHYKITPIYRELRQRLCIKPRSPGPKHIVAEILLGISTDEVSRAKPSRWRWAENVFPLLDARMNRNDCHRWMERAGWSAPKSACVGCPFRRDSEWRALSKDEMADAIFVDDAIRSGFGNNTGELFLHRSCAPLRDVDLRTAEDRGQANLFNMECEGMCGV